MLVHMRERVGGRVANRVSGRLKGAALGPALLGLATVLFRKLAALLNWPLPGGDLPFSCSAAKAHQHALLTSPPALPCPDYVDSWARKACASTHRAALTALKGLDVLAAAEGPSWSGRQQQAAGGGRGLWVLQPDFKAQLQLVVCSGWVRMHGCGGGGAW